MKNTAYFILALCFFSWSHGQDSSLPDLAFEATTRSLPENKDINLEITVINKGVAVSEKALLSIEATYASLSQSDIDRLKLVLVDTDHSLYQVYRITRDIPSLKPNESIEIKLELKTKFNDDSSFFIQIDRENHIQEANKNNNIISFPESKAQDYGILADVVIKNMLPPVYDHENEMTILEIEVQNVGFANAKDVTLNTWEIVTAFTDIPERDLKALLGERWQYLSEVKLDPIVDTVDKLNEIKAGEAVTVLIAIDGWVYNPNCKIGAEVSTTSKEINIYNNSASFLAGG